MKAKILSGFLVTILSMLVLTNLVFAATTFSPSGSLLFSQNKSSSTFSVTPATITNGSLISATLSLPTTILYNDGTPITFTSSANPSLTSFNTTSTVTITSIIDYTKIILGKIYSGNVIVSANATDNSTVPLTIQKSYCSSGDIGTNLTIDSLDINNKDGDELTWMPLEEIEIQVEVKNNNVDDSDKIDTLVKLGLYDSTGKELLKLDKVKLGKISGDGSSKTAIFNFKVPADFGVDAGSYLLYVKAYKNGNEEQICTSLYDSAYSKTISSDRETDEDLLIALDAISANPYPASCTEETTVEAKVVNVGDEDQEKVKVTLYNKELGIDTYQIISNLDQGDYKTIKFSFIIPANATEKTYKLDLRSLYGYDDNYKAEDNAAYDYNSDVYNTDLKVEGNCIKKITKNVAISSTSLQTAEEDIQAGKEVTIKANIKNTGSSDTTYVISTEGVDGFATVSAINPTTFTIKSGESKDVLITLKLNSDASGEQVFSIKSTFDGGEVKQSVSLIVPEKTSLFSDFALGESLKQNWIIWVIVIINVILIIAVILVAIRMARA